MRTLPPRIGELLQHVCGDETRLPLEGSNLDYLIQSGAPRATKTDNLTGSGVLTSIGALLVFCEAADSVKPRSHGAPGSLHSRRRTAPRGATQSSVRALGDETLLI